MLPTPDQRLPEGVTLAPGEQILGGGEFRVSNLLFFMHWRMVVTSKRIIGRVPNTILAIIPLGFNQVSYPLPNVAGVAVGRSYSALAFLVGALMVLAFGSRGNIVGVLIGAAIFVAAFRNNIQITNSGGDKIRHGVSFLDRAAAESFVHTVNTVIATHTGSSHSAIPEMPTSRTASQALADLQALRDQGMVTDDEFETKRREIIARV